MILHIGNGKTVHQRDIIGIFDMDNTTVTAAGREYLARAQREGRVSYADYDIPRSFILCVEGDSKHTPPHKRQKSDKNQADKVILSHISSLSLAARTETFLAEE
jgi:hypothetical protein